MINYTEKGIGLVELLADKGVVVKNGQVVYSPLTDEETQSLIDNHDPLPTSRQQALERINRQTQAYMDSLTEDYPEFEKATWELQRQEAQAYSNDSAALTPTIDTIALNRGVDRITLINKILTNTNNWSVLAASIAGQRQSLLDQVWTETDYKVIDQIKFEV